MHVVTRVTGPSERNPDALGVRDAVTARYTAEITRRERERYSEEVAKVCALSRSLEFCGGPIPSSSPPLFPLGSPRPDRLPLVANRMRAPRWQPAVVHSARCP